MSDVTSAGQEASQRKGLAAGTGEVRPAHRKRRRWTAAGFVVGAIAVLAVVSALTGVLGRAGGQAVSNPFPVVTGTVTEGSLTQQTQVDGTLGDAGSYTVVNRAQGTLTALPPTGQVVHQGQVLYQVSGSPVVLLYGLVPAYRALSKGMTGPDVTELNKDLVRLGYSVRGDVAELGWDYFGWDTADGLEKLQQALGETVTGNLALGAAVFLPGAIQVSGPVQGVMLGGTATPGEALLTASSTTPQITIDLDPSLQTDVKDGDKVAITLPRGTTTQGVVSSVGTVASSSSNSGNNSGSNSSGNSGNSSGSSTIPVEVSLIDPKAAAGLSAAPVTVTIITASVTNTLIVPVTALLAQSNGGYAVEVTGPGGHHLVTVTLGLFDDADGMVQVTGFGLAAGQHVVVAGS